MNRNELMILIEYIYYIFGITTYKCYIHNLQVTAMFDIVVKRRTHDRDRNTCNLNEYRYICKQNGTGKPN